MKFEIFKGKDQHYYFRLKARNGKIILGSEAYSVNANARNGVDTIISVSSEKDNFERQISSNKKHYFTVKARNGEIVGKSQLYKTKYGMEKGIAAVRRVNKDARVVDLSR